MNKPSDGGARTCSEREWEAQPAEQQNAERLRVNPARMIRGKQVPSHCVSTTRDTAACHPLLLVGWVPPRHSLDLSRSQLNPIWGHCENHCCHPLAQNCCSHLRMSLISMESAQLAQCAVSQSDTAAAAMFHSGQSYSGQFLLRPGSSQVNFYSGQFLLRPGSSQARFFSGQFYLGQFYSGQLWLAPLTIQNVKIKIKKEEKKKRKGGTIKTVRVSGFNRPSCNIAGRRPAEGRRCST